MRDSNSDMDYSDLRDDFHQFACNQTESAEPSRDQIGGADILDGRDGGGDLLWKLGEAHAGSQFGMKNLIEDDNRYLITRNAAFGYPCRRSSDIEDQIR